jgi:hypothetical protein
MFDCFCPNSRYSGDTSSVKSGDESDTSSVKNKDVGNKLRTPTEIALEVKKIKNWVANKTKRGLSKQDKNKLDDIVNSLELLVVRVKSKNCCDFLRISIEIDSEVQKIEDWVDNINKRGRGEEKLVAPVNRLVRLSKGLKSLDEAVKLCIITNIQVELSKIKKRFGIIIKYTLSKSDMIKYDDFVNRFEVLIAQSYDSANIANEHFEDCKILLAEVDNLLNRVRNRLLGIDC